MSGPRGGTKVNRYLRLLVSSAGSDVFVGLLMLFRGLLFASLDDEFFWKNLIESVVGFGVIFGVITSFMGLKIHPGKARWPYFAPSLIILLVGEGIRNLLGPGMLAPKVLLAIASYVMQFFVMLYVLARVEDTRGNQLEKCCVFTLIELIVVSSIIFVLAGLILPLFGRVKEEGDFSKLLSEGHQIGPRC